MNHFLRVSRCSALFVEELLESIGGELDEGDAVPVERD
jgi:hypothetical protein